MKLHTLTLLSLTSTVLGFTPPSPLRSTSTSSSLKVSPSSLLTRPVIAGAAAAVAGGVGLKKILDRPSRPYTEDSVKDEYDAWTQDGILEYYWGEHIHLGYYTPNDMEKGFRSWRKKDFKQAKFDFTDKMMEFGGFWGENKGWGEGKELKVLDVGCGVGGSSRYIARALGPKSTVTGITLSPNQVARATELAEEQSTPNANFEMMNALEMTFPDNSFDIVWACESGEHMPDKKKYIDEMMRVLKPGGKFVMATWCQRDDRNEPFSKKDLRDLRFLYEEWTHPYFISIEKYAELIEDTGMMADINTDDWNEQTIASWRHSVWVGVEDPRGFIFKPRQYFKCIRDGYCLERMHRAFNRGLMQYGMFTATKKQES